MLTIIISVVTELKDCKGHRQSWILNHC